VARALITNDDGIDSPGLRVLAAAARDAGLDVVVAAPHVD
jgi:5'-nucleotidase